MKHHATTPSDVEVDVFGTLGLSSTDVEMMAWFYADGMSYDGIADLLGTTGDKVRNRLATCRLILQRAGLPEPQRTERQPLQRKINLGGIPSGNSMDGQDPIDRLLSGEMPRLIRDRNHHGT